MVDALIVLGADPLAANKAGETALDWAARRGETPAVASLRKAGSSSEGKMRSSAQKALTLLQRSGAQFATVSKCNSCHHQSLPQMAFEVARTRGFDVDQAAERQQIESVIAQFKTVVAEGLRNRDRIPDPPIALSYALIGFAATGHPRDEVTDAMAQIISAWQDDTGRFHSLPPIRPPLESSDVTATALSVRAIQLYGPPQDARVARAVEWLREVKPHTTEEHAMQLLGLTWGHARPHDIRKSMSIAAYASETGWRMGTATNARNRCICHWSGAGRIAHRRARRFRTAIPKRAGLSAADAVSRRIVARPHSCVSGANAEGQRIPPRHSPVDLGSRHELGRWPCCWGCLRSRPNKVLASLGASLHWETLVAIDGSVRRYKKKGGSSTFARGFGGQAGPPLRALFGFRS